MYAAVAAGKPSGVAGGGGGGGGGTGTGQAAIPLCTGAAGGGSLMGNPMARAISPTAQRLLPGSRTPLWARLAETALRAALGPAIAACSAS